MDVLINQCLFEIHTFFSRVGVQTRVRGEGAGAGQVLAETRLRGHEIPLRLPPASLHIQVSTFLSCLKPTLPLPNDSGKINEASRNTVL